jgi:hypothetical protein
MTDDKLQIVRNIQNGSNYDYLLLALNNDRQQFLTRFKKANPAFYLKNEALFTFDSNAQIARVIIKAWKMRAILMPKFSFVPMQNEWLEVIERVKLISQ